MVNVFFTAMKWAFGAMGMNYLSGMSCCSRLLTAILLFKDTMLVIGLTLPNLRLSTIAVFVSRVGLLHDSLVF